MGTSKNQEAIQKLPQGTTEEVAMFKRVGMLALVLSAGMAVSQPATAKAADWHSRDGYHQRRENRDWNRDRNRDRDRRRHEWRDRERWENQRNGGYLYFNSTPAPRYYYTPAPGYSYPNYGYQYNQCPY
jgi:hypothetical protein